MVTVYVYVVQANTSTLKVKNCGNHLPDYQATTLNTTTRIFSNNIKHAEQFSASMHYTDLHSQTPFQGCETAAATFSTFMYTQN
jgi:hypothetical protein